MPEDAVTMLKHALNFDLLTDLGHMLNVKLVWLVDRTACMHKAKADTVACLTPSWLWYLCYDVGETLSSLQTFIITNIIKHVHSLFSTDIYTQWIAEY